MDANLFMIVGFLLAAYSIVANDAIQTLGTFLASNANRPWWVLWLYACGILTAVLVTGWIVNNGDPAFGRLERFPLPTNPDGTVAVGWLHALPPLAILILTRFGIPVSTTFLVLTVFRPSGLDSMLVKSAGGYLLAFVAGLLVVSLISAKAERHFLATKDREPGLGWVVFQWCSTGFLWAVWLMQDLANIFAYLSRDLSVWGLVFALAAMLLLHAVIFYRHGGEIQKIVTSKTNTTDIRSATIIDLIFGAILLYKVTISTVPMSTTWVFLGLLAGREIAFSLRNVSGRSMGDVGRLIGKDALKALIGLVVSVALAFGIPALLKDDSNHPDAIEGATESVSESSGEGLGEVADGLDDDVDDPDAADDDLDDAADTLKDAGSDLDDAIKDAAEEDAVE